MSAGDWIGLGVIVLVIAGVLLLLSQITKPYDVKNEEEFQQRRKEGGLLSAGMMGLQPMSVITEISSAAGHKRKSATSTRKSVSPKSTAAAKPTLLLGYGRERLQAKTQPLAESMSHS